MSVKKPPKQTRPSSPDQTVVRPSPSGGGNDGDGFTRVDLGDDLLAAPEDHEQAAQDALEAAEKEPLATSQIPDQLESARILAGEGILEEAKRVLRRVLLADRGHTTARRMLEEIHEAELKQILAESESPARRRPSRPGQDDSRTAIEISADVVLRDLDRDLGLGMFGPGGAETAETGPQLSLFQDRQAMLDFASKLDRELATATVPDRIDIGIGFLEMGLHELAARQFQAAVDKLRLEDSAAAPGPLLSATGLLAHALIAGGRAFEATLALQAPLADAEVPRESKLDLIYLMGRAHEAAGKRSQARQWYQQAEEIEPGYRDARERLARK